MWTRACQKHDIRIIIFEIGEGVPYTSPLPSPRVNVGGI
jgi:hypothetical protein